MLQNIESEINKNIAIIYASQQFEQSTSSIYTNDDEYVVLTDPIKRIADMRY